MAQNLDKAENQLSKVSDFAYLRAVDGSGNSVQLSKADIARILGNHAEIMRAGGVLIATRESDGYPRFRQIDQAASYKNQAVGVAIFEGGHLIIVAKDEAAKQWATSNVSGGNAAKGREAALADFAGRSNTDTIVTTLGANAPAAQYCRGYYPSNVEQGDANFGAGRWWIPSAGELFTIWSHLLEVNRAMAAISGTALDRGTWYWSSSELSAAHAWTVDFGTGALYGGTRAYEGRVRPVSAFY